MASDSLPWACSDELSCSSCDIGSGIFYHLLGYCLFVRITWREADLKVINGMPLNWNGGAKTLIEYIISPSDTTNGSVERRNFTLFAAILFFYIWRERNTALHTGVKISLPEFIRFISARFVEYKSLTNDSIDVMADRQPSTS